ncbi:MAG: alpha-E domain-containing protein [Betaproteobacteria bacterium]|nr:alpha-E domain-containing protein [Betaproteobacteria bacterium]
MLSRLADNLYWMSRYMERAENTARMLDVQHQASMLPGDPSAADQQWQALLRLFELESKFLQRHERLEAGRVLVFMVADEDNPSSILGCISAARENARAVRVVLAPELWECVNSTWLELRTMLRSPRWRKDPGKILEWVKFQSHLFRGVMIGTMLKDEAYRFSRMGTFIERADNTARILDVKFVAPRQGSATPGGSADYYFWASVLRSVSAFEIYRKVYRDVITPIRIAELLIQRADMPRSLLACLNELLSNLEQVSLNGQSESIRMAGRMRADLQYLRVDDAFEPQLHSFLTQFMFQVDQLGQLISQEFLVPLNAPLTS